MDTRTGLILSKLIFFCVFSCTAYARDNAKVFLFGGEWVTTSMRITVDDMNDGK